MTNTQNIPWQKIVKFGQKDFLDSNWFSTSWILGRFCNYECSYCWDHAHSKVVDFFPLNTYCSLVDNIKMQANNNGFTNFHWTLSGGEPTAFKEFNNLVSYISADEKSIQSLSITTNLSPGLTWWQQFIDSSSLLSSRAVVASYHDEFASESKFIEKCLLLQKNGIRVNINQVMDVDRFNEQYNRCLLFSRLGVSVTLKPKSTKSAADIITGYSEEQLELMKTSFPQIGITGSNYFQMLLYDADGETYRVDHAERFNLYGFTRFKDWYCSAGHQGIIIRGNDISRGFTCKDTPLGSVSDGFSLLLCVKPCITTQCVTSADTKIPKYKDI